MKYLGLALSALLVSAPAATADVTLFLGPRGGVGDIVVTFEAGSAPLVRPPALQGIQLLQVDFIGRTPLMDLIPNVTRLHTDIPGASRIELPRNRGSLYHFRRDDAGGGPTVFGYFRVGPLGHAVPVWERPGTGPSGDQNPFLPRLSVRESGTSILLATTPAAGGDLVQINLPTNQVVNRTPHLPPQTFLADGFCLLPSWGVGLTSNGLLRFNDLPGERAQPVTFTGGQPAWFADEVVCSRDGSTVAFLAGDAPDKALVFGLRQGGRARQASCNPAPLEGAGFLPNHPSGPLLALSTDGTQVAFQSKEGIDNREVFVREVNAPLTVPEVQITADANFEDTLNDSGVIAFFSPDSLVMMVGERDGPAGGLENADVFRIDDLSAANPVLTNLSRTSGQTATPFVGGELKTEDGIWILPDGPASLTVQRDTDTEPSKLLRVDWVTGVTSVLLEDIDEVTFAGSSGDRGYLVMHRELPGRPLTLVELPYTGVRAGTALTADLPGASNFLQTSVAPSGRFAGILATGGQRFLGRYDPLGVDADLLTPFSLTYGPTMGFTPNDTVAAAVVEPNTGESLFLTWSVTGQLRSLYPTLTEGIILPGF